MGIGPSSPTHHHSISINKCLTEFSNSLSPSPEFYRKGNQIASEIFNLIRQSRSDVARCLVGGGMGKRTAISESDDFDIFVFFNNQSPSTFRKIQIELQNLLCRNKYESVKIINEMTIRFYSEGIQFDLSVALNLRDMFSDQRKGTISKIVETRGCGKTRPAAHAHLYGPSLSEYAMDFVRKQTPFVQSVIRLAKYWNKNVRKVGGYMSGRSLLIELVAIQACQQIEDESDILAAISAFFIQMVHFQDMYFYFTTYYSANEIPEDVLKEKPLVLDPVNPYNNLARRVSQAQSSEFSRAAKRCLFNLKNWRYEVSLDSQESAVARIFESNYSSLAQEIDFDEFNQ